MQENQKPDGVPWDGRTLWHFILFVLQTWAVSLEIFLHTGIGRNYPGFAGLAVFLFVPLFASAFPDYDPRPFLWFLGLFLVTCIIQRGISAVQYRRTRVLVHSYSNGSPILARFFPHWSDQAIRTRLEPLVLALLGVALFPIHPPLGLYVFAGTGALLLVKAYAELCQWHQAQNLNDAMLEQEHLMQTFRSFRRDD